jgi:hypothetical protein
MADPGYVTATSSPVTPSDPDPAALSSSITDIQSQYSPLIEEQEHTAERYEKRGVEAEESAAAEAEKASGNLTAEDEEMKWWVAHTPTRQAAYANTMQATAPLSILMALGGKVTRLNGQQMLGALNGMVKGFNAASEKHFDDAYQAWQSAYAKMQQHQRRLEDAQKMMLEAYRGRADAYQKAAEAARRMTGDLLRDEQQRIADSTNLFKAQSEAAARIKRIDVAWADLRERIRQHNAQQAHWKEVEAKAAKMPPEVKAQLGQEQNRWKSAKSQEEANLRRRGQIESDITMPADQKSAAIQRIDDEDQALRMEQDRAQSNADAIVAGYIAQQGTAPPGTSPVARPAGPNGNGAAPAPAPAASPPTAKAPAGAPLHNEKGWPLMSDGKGAFAYVGPNGEVEELAAQPGPATVH